VPRPHVERGVGSDGRDRLGGADGGEQERQEGGETEARHHANGDGPGVNRPETRNRRAGPQSGRTGSNEAFFRSAARQGRWASPSPALHIELVFPECVRMPSLPPSAWA